MRIGRGGGFEIYWREGERTCYELEKGEKSTSNASWHFPSAVERTEVTLPS